MAEFAGLVEAIGLDLVFSRQVRLRAVRAATYIGSGLLAEIAADIAEKDVDLVLVDAALSPVQQRNLERGLDAKVLDRTGLILEIFGDRAATREGVLQVELAHLNYQKGRLVRSWTHLERQRGGGGFLGGPGETQIESDRRALQDKIKILETKLDRVRRIREQQREPRAAKSMPTVALVGYTNAGKSTLFNRLTGADVVAKDLLFATLDPTLRRVRLPHGREFILSDTVGFISDLPTDLVAAFRATLEEVGEADLILHVRDAASPDAAIEARDVLKVLAQLGVTADKTPIIEVWNKIDLIGATSADDPLTPALEPVGQVAGDAAISAMTGEGIPQLLSLIEKTLAVGNRTVHLRIPHERGADLAWVYAHAEVVGRSEPDETGTELDIRIDPRYAGAFAERFAGQVKASAP